MSKPAYPPYAVPDLTDLMNPGTPWLTPAKKKAGLQWKEPTHMDVKTAEDTRDKIKSFLKGFSDLKHVTQMPKSTETERVATLFLNDDETAFLRSPAFKALKRDVEGFGVLFLDTEFASANAMKNMGCKQNASPGTIDLVQLGGMSGSAALLQVQFDCRKAHKCHCPDKCGLKTCPSIISTHAPWEYAKHFHNYGVSVPDVVVDWLKDSSIFKVQSQVIRTDGSLGDIERLERLLGVKISGFIELQNLTLAWFPQRGSTCTQKDCPRLGHDFGQNLLLDQHVEDCHGGNVTKKSGNSYLAEQLGVVPANEHYQRIVGRPIWQVQRRKPYKQWTAPLRFYDLSDVLVPAIFLLQVGIDIVKKERATCVTTNIVPYLRQILMVYKNEPSLAVNNKFAPPQKKNPFREWRDCNYKDVQYSEALSFPWRPGMPKSVHGGVAGPIIARSLRQLACELASDAFRIGLSFADIHDRYHPPRRFQDRLATAQETWATPSLCEEPSDLPFLDPPTSRTRFGPVQQLARDKVLRHGMGRKRFAGATSNPGLSDHKRLRAIPNHKMNVPIYYGRCFHCGSTDHTKKTCRDRRSCPYPLCAHKNSTHHLRVCDVLHGICRLCRLRGHSAGDHRHFDTVSLLKIALLWNVGGVYTSLPTLSLDSQFWRQPSSEECAFDVFNKTGTFGAHQKNL